MAKDTANATDEALEKYAFALFTHRSSGVQRRSAELLTKECFRDAEAFMETSRKILAGDLDVKQPAGIQLSEVCAPNLKPTHPLNMVSKRFNLPGDGAKESEIEAAKEKALDRVKQIHNRLSKDSSLEAFPEYDWGKAEVSTAREVFPAYVGSN